MQISLVFSLRQHISEYPISALDKKNSQGAEAIVENAIRGMGESTISNPLTCFSRLQIQRASLEPKFPRSVYTFSQS